MEDGKVINDECREKIEELSKKLFEAGERNVRTAILSIISLTPTEEALDKILEYLGGE